jgi:hypothetical protein
MAVSPSPSNSTTHLTHHSPHSIHTHFRTNPKGG